MDADIREILVFSIVMLLFMFYPAMVSAKKIKSFSFFKNFHENALVILLTIFYSLAIGVFLRYF